eukprot:15351624-Ditylum_brightwellii.AAC.1
MASNALTGEELERLFPHSLIPKIQGNQPTRDSMRCRKFSWRMQPPQKCYMEEGIMAILAS